MQLLVSLPPLPTTLAHSFTVLPAAVRHLADDLAEIGEEPAIRLFVYYTGGLVTRQYGFPPPHQQLGRQLFQRTAKASLGPLTP